MVRLLKASKSEKGFSLVELMIVVAIIGILTAIAIPNFQRFQLKSRQSEARNNLAALYTAEKAFYGEWSAFFADFRDIGFKPEGRLIYRTGFSNAGVNAPANYTGGVITATNAAVQFNTGAHCGTTGASCTEFLLPGGDWGAMLGTWSTRTTATGGEFTAGARGDIRGTAGNSTDIWVIDSTKTLLNVSNGIDAG